MAEDLATYLQSLDVKVSYMHSDIDTIERMKILRNLRLGHIDVLVGINLLREGLDLPEVSLVAILDADKEGFLRDSRSLIQTIGRTARNAKGKAILYAEKITKSMDLCIRETSRRREIQASYNEKHGIIPKTISKSIEEIQLSTRVADAGVDRVDSLPGESDYAEQINKEAHVKILDKEMTEAVAAMDFERAALLRDEIFELRVSE
jgi:excinuclease ABC subunit B